MTPQTVRKQDQYNHDAPYRAFGVSRKAWGGEPMIDFILAIDCSFDANKSVPE